MSLTRPKWTSGTHRNVGDPVRGEGGSEEVCEVPKSVRFSPTPLPQKEIRDTDTNCSATGVHPDAPGHPTVRKTFSSGRSFKT